MPFNDETIVSTFNDKITSCFSSLKRLSNTRSLSNKVTILSGISGHSSLEVHSSNM